MPRKKSPKMVVTGEKLGPPIESSFLDHEHGSNSVRAHPDPDPEPMRTDKPGSVRVALGDIVADFEIAIGTEPAEVGTRVIAFLERVITRRK